MADDLRVPPGPGLPHGLTIPAGELVERFSRSSGPGGQGVNTTDSRVQLEWDPATSAALTETQRWRALAVVERDHKELVVFPSRARPPSIP